MEELLENLPCSQNRLGLSLTFSFSSLRKSQWLLLLLLWFARIHHHFAVSPTNFFQPPPGDLESHIGCGGWGEKPPIALSRETWQL